MDILLSSFLNYINMYYYEVYCLIKSKTVPFLQGNFLCYFMYYKKNVLFIEILLGFGVDRLFGATLNS